MTFPEKEEKVIKLSKAFHANDDQLNSQPEAQSSEFSFWISLIFSPFVVLYWRKIEMNTRKPN